MITTVYSLIAFQAFLAVHEVLLGSKTVDEAVQQGMVIELIQAGTMALIVSMIGVV